MTTVSETNPIVVKSSPSHGFNNLNHCGNLLCYVHQNEVNIVSDTGIAPKAKNTTRKVQLKGNVPITQAKWVKVGDERQLLVISGHQTIEIVDSENLKILFSFPLPADEKAGKSIGYGIALIFNGKDYYILCGSSSGEIYVFEVKKEIKLIQQLKKHKHGITDLCNDEKNPNIWASTDTSGVVNVWKAFEIFCTFENPDRQPCTSLSLKGDKLFTAFGSGHVRIWSITRKQKAVEIAAHSQAINAIHLHPNKDLFATASDDGIVSLWQFKSDTSETFHLASLAVPNHLLTGVQFCGEKQTFLVVSPYDSHSLPVWQLQFK